MAHERMIPMLPCRDIDEIAEFYQALGFTRTYRQTRPNPYVSLRREDIELHFFGMPAEFDPAESYGTCGVFVPSTFELHAAFAAGMREKYGKLLISGIPRMTRPRKRKNVSYQPGFTLIDPGGNYVRFFPLKELPEGEAAKSKLAVAMDNAVVMGDSHGDPAQAAKILDGALRRAEPDTPAADLVEALAYRAELAVTQQDHERARELLEQLRQVTLDDTERVRLADALTNVADLESILGQARS
ncbi:VOC family protein [Nonomuraea soli]|uniref:Catechol 2,3-dioxygenase-like lactoylglutathione lyase family enzyme n=1 Tax=Nonomuraea soli TaxID=1032476 RepID=A0A7W0CT43_9ACTN|nr:VOC family protein [Nonomuraea soli]MBA2896742.1 catechol 2,3-dioxygenase-like lactoylglutathione lyase family enzyme [Nonomuraea soli]